ncbi:8070_t:CDS:2 [Funneliformis caledonium]|uniref:8070_t:CDS:1 n=1 Tax=Funneliformis caledonium TaxID=1117310 RepID=A0A9N8YSG0_9GLOM|nr:8070_t:CDS:2 [Funneliformis caledonium]
MGDALTINKKKHKIHLSIIKYTQQKLGVPATSSPPSTITFATNQDNEFFYRGCYTSLIIFFNLVQAKTYDEHIDLSLKIQDKSERTKQKPRSSNPSDNKVLDIEKCVYNLSITCPKLFKIVQFSNTDLSGLSFMTNNFTTKPSAEELEDENEEEIKFDLLDILTRANS